jgi:hypothetical protein
MLSRCVDGPKLSGFAVWLWSFETAATCTPAIRAIFCLPLAALALFE